MKFSIRDLLLVTVIVALALGWWMDRRFLVLRLRNYEARDKMIEARDKMIFGSSVDYSESAPISPKD